MDTTGMMDCFIMDKERERPLAQLLHLMILLVVVLTMLHSNFFSRKAVMYFCLFKWLDYIFMLSMLFYSCYPFLLDMSSCCMWLECVFMLGEFTTLLYSGVIHFFWRCHCDPRCCSKNGSLVGAVCKDIKGPLFPTIAVHSQNEE